MIYIKRITLLENHHGNLTQGLEIDCKELNLIVGDQGCGKSSLLHLLRDNGHINNTKFLQFASTENAVGVDMFYFDAEKDNPRMADVQNYSNPLGQSVGIGVGAALGARFMSHGECLQEFTVNGIGRLKDCIAFFDEPESAMSLRNQYELIKSIDTAINSNTQLFIATHCLPLIESVDEVYSMEHCGWMSSKDFIDSQKNKATL